MSAAFREAYNVGEDTSRVTVNRKAFELGREHPGVVARIRQLQEQIYGSIDSNQILAELEEDRQGAREAKQFSAAITAVKVKAQVTGILDTKTDSAATVLGELANLVRAIGETTQAGPEQEPDNIVSEQ